MTLDEQRYTIERALGERMIHHAFSIMRQWATEIDFARYDGRMHSLVENYDYIFRYYLTSEDPERDELLNRVTGHAYRLADEMYVDLCIKRGIAPDMKGFNLDNPESVARYFACSLRIQPEDLQWIYNNLESDANPVLTLMALAALVENLHHCFNEDALRCLITAITSNNVVQSEQALITSILLLASYDVRIDYFPELQELFLDQIGDGEHAFELLCALVNTSATRIKDLIRNEKFSLDNLPDEMKELLDVEGGESIDEQLDRISGRVPDADNREVVEQVAELPETWVFDAIIGDNEQRNRRIEEVYLNAGRMDLMWDRIEDAEAILLHRLRSERATAADYMNYGHCCFLRGDRMMAYENYREAKRLFGSLKEFFFRFRPDRHILVDKGVPLDQVYLMEDNMLTA